MKRTFGIISYPDAGKTALIEKFLLIGKTNHTLKLSPAPPAYTWDDCIDTKGQAILIF